jgi:hypothetical protein
MLLALFFSNLSTSFSYESKFSFSVVAPGSKEVGLEVNTEKTKYIVTCCLTRDS